MCGPNEADLARDGLDERLRTNQQMNSLYPKGAKAFRRITFCKLAAIFTSIGLALTAFGQSPPAGESPALMRLALRLFKDSRFSTPQGDLQNSCASCHLMDEDPQGMRAHTDFFARSWVPWRAGDLGGGVGHSDVPFS